jgi:hypothetical protein
MPAMRALLAALLIAATPGVHHTPAGKAAAHRALLRPADLAGWTAGATPKKVGALTCRASTAVKGAVETGSAASPTYQQSTSGPFVSQTAYVYSTATGAAAMFEHVSGATALSCLAASLGAGDPSGTVAFVATKKQVLPAPHVTGKAAAYRVVGRATVSAQKVTVYVDLLLVQRGKAITALTYSSFSTPVGAALEQKIARAAAGRL